MLKRFSGMITVLVAALAVVGIALTTHGQAAQARNGQQSVQVNLVHAPHGMAKLMWNPGTKHLSVTIALTGLKPNSPHPAHIHKGNCGDNGAVIYTLNNVVADAAGNARATTEIANVGQSIPTEGWYINVHNGPGLTPAIQFTPLACGDVKAHAAEKDRMQFAGAELGDNSAANQDVSGKAKLTLENGKLTVVVMAEGFVPGSAHAAHIHAGSCQNQVPGSVVYGLNNLVADSKGNAQSTTVISSVQRIPAQGWYINLHFSTDLSTQAGYDPVACGNVVMK